MWKDSLRKVVLRRRDGTVLAGFAYQTDLKDTIKFITRDGKESDVPLSELKAVFFVRDFKGSPERNETKFFQRAPVSDMLWVRVEFFDNEALEGKVSNSTELFNETGFYLWPSDQDTNNQSVFVLKAALKSFAVLGIA